MFGGDGWGGSFGARGGDGGISGTVSVGGTSPSTTAGAALRGGCLIIQNGPATLKLAIGTGGGGGGSIGVIKVFAAQQINTDDPTKVSPLPSM